MIATKIRAYLYVIRIGIIEALTFRTSYLLTIIGNFIYFVVVYYLWKSIFVSNNASQIQGMKFQDVVIYLVFATTIYRLLDCFLVSTIDNDIKSGKIAIDLMRPIQYPIFMFLKTIGTVCVSFVSTFLPVFVLFVVLGILSVSKYLLVFIVSLLLSVMLSYLIDFFTAMICFYTQSGWGVNLLKQILVQIFAGVLIPISFFGENVKKLIYFMPFQAIYNNPMQILISNDIINITELILIQVFWIMVLIFLDYIFWRKMINYLSVNGG